MSENARCPQCDAEIPTGAPAGLCPKCLFQAGLDSQQPVAPQFPPTQASPPSSRFEPPAPEELAARFPQLEIHALLGRGGMGAVYKAKQRGLDRLVALKILPPEVSSDPAFAERFTREARALAKLTHSNIVTVYDFCQADGLFYFLMEYVDGVNLRQAIQVGDMTPQDALAIVPQICAALQFAHDEGIVHRDIKPENILIDKLGRVKIADFGLAKLLGQDASDHSLTGTHQVMGTLRYMAPEQMQGSREVDHRADIYSLGVVFYELLTGELPMGKFAPPSKRVQVDVRLDEIVLRALEQQPEQRYQHASEVKTDVDAISRSPSVARPGSAKGMDLAREELATQPAELDHEATLGAITAAALMFAVLILTAFAMWVTGSVRCLIALGVPAFIAPGLENLARRAGTVWIFFAAVGLSLIGSMALIAYGVWLTESPWPLLAIFAPCVGMAAGVAAWQGDEKTGAEEKTGTGPVSLPRAATETHLVQAPADCLLLAAGIAFVTACGVAIWLLASPTSPLISSLVRGGLTIASVTLVTYSVLIGAAALMLRSLRARLLVLLVVVVVGLFLPAVIALNVVMEFRNMPDWPVAIPLWLGIPAALWATVTLFRDDVRRGFDAAAERRAEKAGTDPASLPLAVLPSKRPKLVPVLATFNLFGAILLMLVCAMEEPAAFARSVPRLWQVWEKVDAVLGFAMAAGMFAASIGLFLWKPWARKVTLGVCVFGLASFVFDAPYLARFLLPDAYAEIQQTVIAEGVEPYLQDFVTLGTFVVIFGGMFVVGLTCLIGQLVYFNRPRVVAAFESQGERYGKFIEWLCTGTGAVVGVLSVFGPLALLLGLAALFNGSSGEQTVDSSTHSSGNLADSKTGEVWTGNQGDEHVMFLGSNAPAVSDRLANHLGLDPAQRAAMNQAFEMYFREFKALEEQNTQHETDTNGHQITTITEFRQQVPELAERFWSELDATLDGRQLTLGRKTVGLGMGMFESVYNYRIEIWRVGQINPWYHWKELDPGLADFHADKIKPSSGPELPEKLRRFWKEPARTDLQD